MSRYIGKTADGRQGTIVTTRENYSAPGVNVTQERWDEIFGKKEKKGAYRYKASSGLHKTEEEWWFENGSHFYRRTVDGKVVEFRNETTGEHIGIDCADTESV